MNQEQTEFLRAELCILDTASLGHGPVQVVTRPRAGTEGMPRPHGVMTGKMS